MDTLLRGSFSPVVALLVTVTFAYIAVKRYLTYRKLQHIPGPWYAAISSVWIGYHSITGNAVFASTRVLRQYGSLVRISPYLVVTDDAEFYKSMKVPRSKWRRGKWFEGLRLGPENDNVVSERDEQRHAELRAKLMPGYGGKDVASLESDIDKQILELTKLIGRFARENKSFDFAKYSSYFTLDTLTNMAFGFTAGFLTNDKDMFDYFKTVASFFPIMELGMNVLWIQDILLSRFVQSLAGPKPEDKIGLGPIIGRAHAEVASRFGPDSKPDQPDMLGSFVRNGLTQTECESEAMVQVMAGSDSTAQAIRTTLWHILSSPVAYSKLNQEINNALDKGEISYPVIKDAEARRLPYLQACIREGIRLFMPLTGLNTAVVPPGGHTYKGHYLPESTEVAIGMYNLLRKEENFGPDADTFRPERYIDNDIATNTRYENIQDLAFGYGRFKCLGRDIALTELGKVLFELFRRFDFTIVDPWAPVISHAHGPVIQKNMILRAWVKTDT